MKRVLFLCSGNYYRSRFAEIFFNWHAEQRGLSWQAESRGLAINSCNPGPISHYTRSSLSARGILSESFERHPQAATDDDFALAHHVIALKELEHRPLVETRFPHWRERVEYWQIHDLDCALPDQAIPHLEREVMNLLDRLSTSAN